MSGVGFGFVSPVFEGAEWARHCEEHGAELVACGEAPAVFADPIASLAVYASATSRLRLATSVTAPGLRHPAVLANAFSTLQMLSAGRAVLGIGTGDLSLVQLGERPWRLEPFLEYALAVRELCAGNAVSYGGKRLALDSSVGPVPLFFGADAPRALELAGRHADGVIVGQAFHPDIVRTVVQRVASGAEAAGRSPDDVEIWFTLRAVFTPEPDGALSVDGLDEYVARQAYFLWRVAGSPQPDTLRQSLLERKGFALDDDVAGRLGRYVTEYDPAHAFGSKRNVELLQRLGLKEWAGRLFYASGPPEHVAARVGELVDAGARRFLVPVMAGDRRQAVEQTADVFAALRP